MPNLRLQDSKVDEVIGYFEEKDKAVKE